MKISTLTKFASILCVMLSIASLGLVFFMNLSLEAKHKYLERQLEFRQLGHDLGYASDFLTREARRYTIFGDKRHYDAYWNEVNIVKTRDKVVERLKQLGAPSHELQLIETAKANSDALISTEREAMNAVENGDLKLAQTLMFDTNYDRDKKIIMSPIKEFQAIMNKRAENEAKSSEKTANILLWTTNVTIFLYVLIVLFVIHFLLLQKIGRPIVSLTNAIDQISRGNISTQIPYVKADNEVGDLAKAAQIFKESLIENQELAVDLRKSKNSLEQEVKDRTVDLTEANDELEEFAYRASHDLRSPLVSSIKLLSITEDSIVDGEMDDASESLALAKSSLIKLQSLVGDILLLTKTKNFSEGEQKVDIENMITNALEKMTHMDNFKRLDIQTHFKFKDELTTKKTRINVIIENLISNAIKYQNPNVDKPHIIISTIVDNEFCVIEVEDNGLGIPENQERNLFSMFKRFHPKTAFGSGLGLYMVKKSADMINGKMSFRNLGQGSAFTVKIPIKLKENV